MAEIMEYLKYDKERLKYSELVFGIFALKEVNNYIISKIKIEAFLNIHYSAKDIVFSVSAISKNRKPMKYSFSFDMHRCFFKGEMKKQHFFEHMDQYISQINSHFKKEYLK